MLQSGEQITSLDDLQDIDELHVVEVTCHVKAIAALLQTLPFGAKLASPALLQADLYSCCRAKQGNHDTCHACATCSINKQYEPHRRITIA